MCLGNPVARYPKRHRIPCLCRSFSAKEQYNYWLFRESDLQIKASYGSSLPCSKIHGHFPQKSPTIIGSFAKNDLQIKASESSPQCSEIPHLKLRSHTEESVLELDLSQFEHWHMRPQPQMGYLTYVCVCLSLSVLSQRGLVTVWTLAHETTASDGVPHLCVCVSLSLCIKSTHMWTTRVTQVQSGCIFLLCVYVCEPEEYGSRKEYIHLTDRDREFTRPNHTETHCIRCDRECFPGMGWLRLVGSLKLKVSFAEYYLFYRALLQKRPIILRSLPIVATPYTQFTRPTMTFWNLPDL